MPRTEYAAHDRRRSGVILHNMNHRQSLIYVCDSGRCQYALDVSPNLGDPLTGAFSKLYGPGTVEFDFDSVFSVLGFVQIANIDTSVTRSSSDQTGC